MIDNLQYIYASGNTGNRLTNINDHAQNATGYEGGGQTIGYDVNGNMISMPDKVISVIKYNHLNLPHHLEYSRDGIEMVKLDTKYRADGTKLRKVNTTTISGINGYTTSVKTIDYLDGFQYQNITNSGGGGGGSSSFSASNLESSRAMETQAFSLVDIGGLEPVGMIKNSDLQFFPTSEGFYDYIKNQYIYQYKDHLGNTRVSFGKNSAGVLEIVDANDYYPFGMNHLKSGNSFFGSSSYKNYKYNGKELQETGMYDYGARFYMPDINRTLQVDPLADATLQPYSYANNNPIYYADPTGMVGEAFASIGVVQNKKGEYEIVSAKNDGDFGIYLADSNGSYDIKKNKRVGTLNNSFDFLFTDDTTGKFGGVAKNDNGSNLTLSSNLNLGTILYKYSYKTDNDIDNYYLDLMNLAYSSKNGGSLDLKVSLGQSKYSPVKAGKSYTTLRAASNVLFGFNMRRIYEKYKDNSEFKKEFKNAEDFYSYTMQVVGGYNQWQNNRDGFMNGNGYNKGFPFYGEHTYSGTNIYRGYFHQYTNQKLHKDK